MENYENYCCKTHILNIVQAKVTKKSKCEKCVAKLIDPDVVSFGACVVLEKGKLK